MGVKIQKCGISGNTHHIPSTSDPRTAKLRKPSITLKNSMGRVPCRSQDVSGLGHPYPLTTVIPSKIKRGVLGNGHQRVLFLNKNKNGKTGIPHQKYEPLCPHHPPRTVLPHKILPSASKGKETGPKISPVLAWT